MGKSVLLRSQLNSARCLSLWFLIELQGPRLVLAHGGSGDLYRLLLMCAQKFLCGWAHVLKRAGLFYTVFRTTQIFGVIQSSIAYHNDSEAAAKVNQVSTYLTILVYALNVSFIGFILEHS